MVVGWAKPTPYTMNTPKTMAKIAGMARARRLADSPARTRLLLDCVAIAHAALRTEAGSRQQGIDLAGHCSDQALLAEFRRRPREWSPGAVRIAGRIVHVRMQGTSAMFRGGCSGVKPGR